jgi:hypothetical protein
MRLRFTIRDLLWLTALVAMGVAWWLNRSHLQSRINELEIWKAGHMGQSG